MYYQKPNDPNQYETCTSEISSWKSNEMESTTNDMNNQVPESAYNDLILELIDDYLVEESLTEEEKR